MKVGGAEMSVQALAEEFSRHHNKVGIVTLGKKCEQVEINGVVIFRLKIQNIFWPFDNEKNGQLNKLRWHLYDIYNTSYDKKIGNIFREFEPDIIHTNNLTGFSVFVWSAAKRYNIKIVHTLRDYYLQCPKNTKFSNSSTCKNQCLDCKAFSLIKKKMSQKVDIVIGISKFILEDHINHGYFLNSQKKVIYNGFNIPSNKKKAKQFDKNSIINFGFIGQINEAKGVELLMNSLQSLKTLSNWKLFIAGKIKPEYKKILESILPNNRVEYMGFTQPSDFFLKINVLIVPSIWDEPFGRVVLEGITNNTVVLASNSGGIPELLKLNQSYLFNPTKSGLLQLLKKILSDPSVLNDFQFDIKETSLFSIERTSHTYLSVFNNLIKQ